MSSVSAWPLISSFFFGLPRFRFSAAGSGSARSACPMSSLGGSRCRSFGSSSCGGRPRCRRRGGS
eukprot:2996979-Heterocapsa_arctica.AAC.1